MFQRCFFPAAITPFQKILCAGVGIGVTGVSTVCVYKGGTYCSNAIRNKYDNRIITSLENRIVTSFDNGFCKITDMLPSPNIELPSFNTTIKTVVSYTLFSIYGLISIVVPITCTSLAIVDLRNIIKKLKLQTECCTIVRHSASTALIYPAVLGVSYGISFICFEVAKTIYDHDIMSY